MTAWRFLAPFAFALLFFPCIASAEPPSEGWACWHEAAERYSVAVTLLYAIARVETRNESAHVSGHRNGSKDIGLMLINTWWLPKLREYGITAEALVTDDCLNLNVGAWILSQTLARYGYTWRGIGAYNATTDWKRARYARKVLREVRLIRREYGSPDDGGTLVAGVDDGR